MDGVFLNALNEEPSDSTIPSVTRRTGFLYRLLFFSLILLVFLLSDNVDLWFIDDIVRAVSGVIAIIVIPGECLAVKILGSEKPLGVGFILGLVLNLIFIQIQFTLAVLFGLQFELDIWLASCNLIFVNIVWIIRPDSLKMMELHYWYDKIMMKIDRSLLKIILIGVFIRVGFAIVGLTSFAPDAGLYFDYARSINIGVFQSNVLNDGSVMVRLNGVEEIAHQSTSYLYSISYMLQPAIGNPILLLTITGILLIVVCYEITNRYFNKSSAIIAAILTAVHPTLVYFSVVGYGPELFSLVFLLFAFLLFLSPMKKNSAFMILPGFLLALVESIWFVTFYFFVFLVPILLLVTNNGPKRQSFVIALLLGITLIARYLIINAVIFITLWCLIFGIIYIINEHSSLKIEKNLTAAFGGLLIGTLVLYFPSGLTNFFLMTPVSSIALDELPKSILTIPSLDYILGSTFLIVWHLTPALIISIFVGFIFMRNNKAYRTLLVASVAMTIGIVVALSQIESMRIEYLYTSARFLLFVISFVCILSAVFISMIVEREKQTTFEDTTPRRRQLIQTKTIPFIVLIVFASFLPGYLVFESNASFVRPTDQYAWSGLDSWVGSNTESESVFLVDRAREFAWLTNRKSVVMQLSRVNIDPFNASNQLMALSSRFNASFFLMDGYTLAHWGIFEHLLTHPLNIGNKMIIDYSKAIEQRFNNITDSIRTLTLAYQSQTDDFGSYSRIYQFSNNSFIHFQDENLLDVGWAICNGGSISNASGEIHLTIGPDANYTNTWRPNGYDLNLSIDSGYLVFSFEDAGATIARIEIYDDGGGLISFADRVNDDFYYCPFGEVEIGDIRIVIEGNPGDSVIVKLISAWEVI